MGAFDGKVALVTGAGQGLGRAYATALAEGGAAVAVLDIQGEKAAAVAGALTSAGHTAVAEHVDISDRAAVKDAVERLRQRFGRIDILINNAAAGSTPEGRSLPWYELPQADWDRAMAVNLTGAFYCACAVAPAMIAQGYGKIVNVSSATFWTPAEHLVHYITSKGGVVGLTRALAYELGGSGVTVNAVAPGLTRTEKTTELYDGGVFESYVNQRAIARIEEPADLVGSVLYLCSPASDFVTGQVIVVDGGIIFN